MILDLTSQRIVGAHGLVPSAEHEFPANDWRNLVVAERNVALPPEQQARALAAGHLNVAELDMLESWPSLEDAAVETWTTFAANALALGLAYGPMSATELADGAEVERIAQLLRFVERKLVAPRFSSNWSWPNAGWNPVTEHTFDACLVAHDAAFLVLVLVVDED